MRRIFTRPTVAVEADLTHLNVTAALNKELEQIKENREPTQGSNKRKKNEQTNQKNEIKIFIDFRFHDYIHWVFYTSGITSGCLFGCNFAICVA